MTIATYLSVGGMLPSIIFAIVGARYCARHGNKESIVNWARYCIFANLAIIAVWGLSNEITAASAVNEELLENHRALNELCHRLDPTRLTTMANVFMLEIDSPILTIPDINSYNLYFGWYLGELSQTDEFFDEYHAKYPDRVIGFSEYGADANPAFHSPHPEKGDYTEEYQALYHEHMLRMIEARPWLWATHVWNLFDFAADGRDRRRHDGQGRLRTRRRGRRRKGQSRAAAHDGAHDHAEPSQAERRGRGGCPPAQPHFTGNQKMKTFVQQIMPGTVTGNESQARETLKKIRAAGYDGLELNRYFQKFTKFQHNPGIRHRLSGLPF